MSEIHFTYSLTRYPGEKLKVMLHLDRSQCSVRRQRRRVWVMDYGGGHSLENWLGPGRAEPGWASALKYWPAMGPHQHSAQED